MAHLGASQRTTKINAIPGEFVKIGTEGHGQPFFISAFAQPSDIRKASGGTNNWRRMHGYPLRRGEANKRHKEFFHLLKKWS